MAQTAKIAVAVSLYCVTKKKSIARGVEGMNNFEIRQAMKENRIYNYEVAAAIGVSEFTLSRKLRNELGHEEKEKILAVIDKLAKGAK